MGVFSKQSAKQDGVASSALSGPVVGSAMAVRTDNRPAPAAYTAARSVTASAERVDLSQAWVERSKGYSGWQAEAWTGYERVGEIHYGFNLLANVLSRLRIYPAVVVDPNIPPMLAAEAVKQKIISEQMAKDAARCMAEIQGPKFSNLIRSYALNMSVPGECYLVRLVNQDKTVEWRIVSTDEITVSPQGIMLRTMRGNTARDRLLPPNTYVARIWRSNPRFSDEPDSSMVGISDAVEELLILSRLVRSATRSRLNNGLLFLPDSLITQGTTTSAVETDEDGNEAETIDQGNKLVADLLTSIVTAVSDEGDVAAVAPLMVTGEGNLGDQIKYISFKRDSDAWLVERTERALERILQGIDIPKEIVTGLANVKYSNAVVIDENLYKANVEPLALTFVDALTEVFLRPMMMALGYSAADLANLVNWYDPSEIVTRPNQSEDATIGLDKYALNLKAWRREHGFSEGDAPTEQELAMLMLVNNVQMPPDTQQSLIMEMLPTILGKAKTTNQDDDAVPFPDSASKILDGAQPAQAPQTVPADASTGGTTA